MVRVKEEKRREEKRREEKRREEKRREEKRREEKRREEQSRAEQSRAEQSRGEVRGEERREEERRSKKRKPQKKEDPGARKGSKVAKHCVFQLISGSGGPKSRLAKAACAVPAGQMRDEKLHAVVARISKSKFIETKRWVGLLGDSHNKVLGHQHHITTFFHLKTNFAIFNHLFI